MLAGLLTLHLAGVLSKPFAGESKWFSIAVLAIAAVGLLCVAMRRFGDAEWIAEKLVRVAVIGMQIGILSALATVADAIMSGGDVTRVMAGFLGAIAVAFYVSLIALASNVWLDVNIKLLAGGDGES